MLYTCRNCSLDFRANVAEHLLGLEVTFAHNVT